MSSTSSASGLSKRNMSVATGVRATMAPAMSPASGPNQRRTVVYSTPTVATPFRACGISRLQEFSPNMRADSSMGHRNPAGLSTVMKFEESSEPNRKAFQLLVPAWTAAA